MNHVFDFFSNFEKTVAKADVFEETRKQLSYNTGAFLGEIFGGLALIIWEATNG